ncbi:MAG: DUF5107 domain-containing protein [Lachnospiraceae bacterium]|nr:DUF5107 domain-containing protein [Lachnospiraceae bacterium]
MSISTKVLSIQGAPLTGENPLPMFRDRNKSKHPKNNGTLQKEDLELFGYETGFRVLPYPMQDRYSRKKESLQLKLIVLENEYLRAEFLPEYGGRLYSLYSKQTNKELLFRNEVMQPGNLAIRNAWFSGGIEWNIAQLGHTFTTCDDVFFATVKDGIECEFLRMYDYERTRGILWQVDFHLPKNSKQLYAHMVIINDHADKIPMYWWTNIAVREEPGCRIFSESKEVIYIEPQSMLSGQEHSFGRATLPSLPTLLDTDSSYPLLSNYANEYFFQNSKQSKSPWEAISYQEGEVFFERSTQPLRIRKMFCWGNHQGGRNWLNFLSIPGRGNYVEIQAGIAPTQLHGFELEGQTAITFTQAFGYTQIPAYSGNKECYEEARSNVEKFVAKELTAKELLSQENKFKEQSSLLCSEILHMGHGFGALEVMRRKKNHLDSMPKQFAFPLESLTIEQEDWIALLNNQKLSELTETDLPKSWMTDINYVSQLEAYLKNYPKSLKCMLLLSVILYENGKYKDAVTMWKQAIEIEPLPMFYRNLAYASKQEGNVKLAITYMEQGNLLYWAKLEENQGNRGIDQAYFEEYFELLSEDKQDKKLYHLYQQLPQRLKESERIIICVCKAAVELDEFEFLEQSFQREFATIREGDNTMIEVWLSYAKKRGIDESFAPPNIDLRMLSEADNAKL